MPSKASLSAGLGSFLILALGFAWYGLHSAHASGASLSALMERLGGLNADIHRNQEKLAARQQEAAGLQAKLEDMRSSGASDFPLGGKDQATLIMSDPRLHDLYLRQFRAKLAHRFGPMYRAFGLSRAQIDKFEELAAARDLESMDLRAAALALGLDPLDPGIAALRLQQVAQFRAAIAAQVGPGVAHQMEEVARLQPAQYAVENLNSMVSFQSPPLTSVQSGQLLQILANASASYQGGGPADLKTIDWETASAQAAAVLSGPQLETFKAEAQLSRALVLVEQFYSQQQTSQHEK